MSNNYNDVTDFVIPLHRYHCMVRTVVEAIHMFYSPRTIYIVTPKRFSKTIINASKNWIVKKIVVIEEETFFMKTYKLLYHDILKKFNDEKNENAREFGWWYQQLIKIGAYRQISNLSDPYIVWDSDLIPIIKWDIYPTASSPYFKHAILQEKARSEWNNEQYRQSLYALTRLPMNDPDEGTFVTHHFVFYHDVLADLINHIELISNNSWIESIIRLSYTFFRFSEYRTVSAFMNYKYPRRFKYHEYREFGKYGKRIRNPQKILDEMAEFFGELYEISYDNFLQFVKYTHTSIPSYLQIEHI